MRMAWIKQVIAKDFWNVGKRYKFCLFLFGASLLS